MSKGQYTEELLLLHIDVLYIRAYLDILSNNFWIIADRLNEEHLEYKHNTHSLCLIIIPYLGYSNQSEYSIHGIYRVMHPRPATHAYCKRLHAGESERLSRYRLARHFHLTAASVMPLPPIGEYLYTTALMSTQLTQIRTG